MTEIEIDVYNLDHMAYLEYIEWFTKMDIKYKAMVRFSDRTNKGTARTINTVFLFEHPVDAIAFKLAFDIYR